MRPRPCSGVTLRPQRGSVSPWRSLLSYEGLWCSGGRCWSFWSAQSIFQNGGHGPLVPLQHPPCLKSTSAPMKPTILTHLYISYITNHGTLKMSIDNARRICPYQKQSWGRAIAPLKDTSKDGIRCLFLKLFHYKMSFAIYTFQDS